MQPPRDMARPSSSRGKSPQPPPAQKPSPATSPAPPKSKAKAKKNTSYKSDGVADNDVFLLPGSDYVVALGVTVLAALVRIFRIYQPSSVVFDEVQCVVRPIASPSPLPPSGRASRLRAC